nr:hypothetical protein [Pirellula staleyi]
MIIDDGPPELPGETTPPPMTSLHRRSAPSAGFGWSHLTAVAMVAALVGVVVGYLFRSSQTDPAPIATQTAAPAIPATDNQPPAPPAAAAPDPQPPAMPSPAPPATPPVSPVGEKNTANAENPASKSPTGDTTPAAANGGTAQPMPAAENPPTPSVPTPVPAPPAVVELKYGPEPLESILALKHGSDPREIKLASFPKSDGSAISKIELLGAPKSLRIEKSKDNSWVVQFNNGTKIGSDIPTAEFTQVEEGSSFALMASQRTPGVAWNDLCGSVIQVIHEKGQEHILYLVKPHLVVTKQGKISPCFVEYNMPYLELMDRFDKELFFDVSDIHIETIPSGNWKSATKGRWQHTYVCHNATEIDTQVEAEFSGQPRKTTKIAIRVRFHQKDSTKLLDENAIQDIGNRLSNYRKVFLDEWEKAKLDRDNAEKDFNAEAKPEEKEKKRQKLDVLKNKFIEIDSSRERFDSDYPKIITTSEGREVIASLSKNASAKSAPRAKVTIGREIKTESQSIKVPYLLLVD